MNVTNRLVHYTAVISATMIATSAVAATVLSEDRKLTPPGITAMERFGHAVAIEGDTVIVGARTANAQGTASGAAYVFDRTTRQQLAKLLPTDGEEADVFGQDVAISGNTVVVGADGDDDLGNFAGAAYIFTVDIQPCPADTNNDRTIDGADLFAVLGSFGNTNATRTDGDVTGNAIVNGEDLFAVLEDFSQACNECSHEHHIHLFSPRTMGAKVVL